MQRIHSARCGVTRQLSPAPTGPWRPGWWRLDHSPHGIVLARSVRRPTSRMLSKFGRDAQMTASVRTAILALGRYEVRHWYLGTECFAEETLFVYRGRPGLTMSTCLCPLQYGVRSLNRPNRLHCLIARPLPPTAAWARHHLPSAGPQTIPAPAKQENLTPLQGTDLGTMIHPTRRRPHLKSSISLCMAAPVRPLC